MSWVILWIWQIIWKFVNQFERESVLGGWWWKTNPGWVVWSPQGISFPLSLALYIFSSLLKWRVSRARCFTALWLRIHATFHAYNQPLPLVYILRFSICLLKHLLFFSLHLSSQSHLSLYHFNLFYIQNISSILFLFLNIRMKKYIRLFLYIYVCILNYFWHWMYRWFIEDCTLLIFLNDELNNVFHVSGIFQLLKGSKRRVEHC